MPVRTSSSTHPSRASFASRASRSDGSDARARLLHAALRLFAEKGYARTSTRSIAQAAGANVAAISYYFGDKAGLYAATFNEPMGGNAGELTRLLDPSSGATLSEALRLFLGAYLSPLKHGEIVRQCVRLHMREAIEPTTLWAEEVERDIRGPHEALVGLLCLHLSLAHADDDVHRLALAIGGLAMQLFVMQDIVDTLRPTLLESPESIDAWAERLHLYAMAMVQAETARRIAPARPSAPSSGMPVDQDFS